MREMDLFSSDTKFDTKWNGNSGYLVDLEKSIKKLNKIYYRYCLCLTPRQIMCLVAHKSLEQNFISISYANVTRETMFHNIYSVFKSFLQDYA